MHIQKSTFVVLVLTCFVATAAIAQQGSEKQNHEISFAKQVQPILADFCYACHGADAKSREAGLRLDIRQDAIDSDAIVPGKPDDSELIERILSDDDDLVMPPPDTKKKLTDKQKEILRKWIQNGAKYEAHWAFQRPVKPTPPKVKNESWCQTDLDRFVLAKLESMGLTPAPKAQPEQLFRRIHLDITGLPPRPELTQSFLVDYRKNGQAAISKWIDRLMESPAWGEHRARYWLDAARYADTHGLHFDNYREMWAYRDWVIRAFNKNQRFDEFTIDQLAGDLRKNPTQDQLIATGFQRCNMTTNEGGTIAEENLAIYAADRVQTFGWVYLGLTTNCAQCHDHKFDPLTMKDFYSLAAYFRNTTQGSHDGNTKDGRGPTIKVFTNEQKTQLAEFERQVALLQKQIKARRVEARPEFENWLTNIDPNKFGISNDNLHLHLPLNQGQGNELVRADDAKNPIKVAKVTWRKDKRFENVVQITPKSIPTLGDFGQFELDDSFTVSTWIKTNNLRGAAPIVARMDQSNGYRGWDVYREGNTIAVHLIDKWPGNAIKVRSKLKSIQRGKWHHVTVTYNGSRNLKGIKIYVDGVSLPITTLTNSLQPKASMLTKTPFKLGQRSAGPVFNGSLSDIRIYRREFSAAEAKMLASMGSFLARLAKPPKERTKQDKQALFNLYLDFVDKTSSKLKRQLQTFTAKADSVRATAPVTHIQKEKANSTAMANILKRGAYDKVGKKVTAVPPASLHALPKGAAANRMGLAQWVVDPKNPLTSRVTVNRFWQELFGNGIVTTPEDFGMMGSAPSHPKLLDWLATDFQENNWDVKRFFKNVMLSATYQQAPINTAIKEKLDRDNQFLSRGPRFRMDAEMIRDYALAASGLLSKKRYGPGIRPYQPKNLWNVVGLPGGNTRRYVQDKGEKLYRRSIYMFWKRMAPPANLEALNAPSREVCVVRRERTNTPLQALVTLNDPQFVEAARVLAETAIKNSANFDKRLDFISKLLINRNFNQRERKIVKKSFLELSEFYKSSEADAKKLISVGNQPPDPKLNASEVATWTMICNQLMNLDETLNK